MTFRKILFWLHLAAGLVAGGVILVMSATGVVLAFEREIVAWAERDARRVEPPGGVPPGAAALPLETLVARARAAAPAGARLADLALSTDPAQAVALNFGREHGVYYQNPYTGELRRPASTTARDFMRGTVELHRYLSQSGDNRPLGKAVTGACNLAFLGLGLTGLVLWWPRAWNLRALRPSLWFVRGASGRARDWNWHNTVGFWSLPVLIVLTVSAAVIGYPWASELVFRAVGEKPQPTGYILTPAAVITPPAPEAPRLGLAAVAARVQGAHPDWTRLTVREGYARKPPGATGPEPITATLRLREGGPDFAPLQLVLNPYDGEIISRTGYAEQSTGRKVRTWLRYLHTGEALGWPGQLLAGLASLGGCVLVYTGFALSWRRFFGRTRTSPRPTPDAAAGP
jgi:uncharacterized iron-regulated membrane protein